MTIYRPRGWELVTSCWLLAGGLGGLAAWLPGCGTNTNTTVSTSLTEEANPTQPTPANNKQQNSTTLPPRPPTLPSSTTPPPLAPALPFPPPALPPFQSSKPQAPPTPLRPSAPQKRFRQVRKEWVWSGRWWCGEVTSGRRLGWMGDSACGLRVCVGRGTGGWTPGG